MNRTSEPIDWTGIKKSFGSLIASYLEVNNFVPKESKCGAYILPQNNEFILDQWVKFDKGAKKVSGNNRQSSEDFSFLPETHDLDKMDNFCLFDDFRRSEMYEGSSEPAPAQTLPRPSPLSDILGPNVNPPRNLDEAEDREAIGCLLTKNIHRRNYHCHKKFHARPKDPSLFSDLLVPDLFIYPSYGPYIKTIHDSFIKMHLNFQYNILLDSIPQDESLFKGELSKKQIKYFFSQVFYHVVPSSLFGSRRNVKKIKLEMNRYLEVAKTKPFTIHSLVEKLDIDSVEWLSKVQSKSGKVLVLCRTLKWFFYTFIWNIIDTYFFVENNKTSKKMIYFRRWLKGSVALNYIYDQVTQKAYEPMENIDVNEKNGIIPVSYLYIQSNKDGVRPVLSALSSEKQKVAGKKINLLLKQLYLKNNEIINEHTLDKIWRSVSEIRNLDKTKPIYFVSCGINDAFGSINQDKLLDIVFGLIDELPDKIPTQWFAIIDSKNTKSRKYTEKEFISPEILPPILPRGALCCPTTKTNKSRTIIGKKILKAYIKASVLEQKIRFGTRNYSLKKGIARGLPISRTLFDFYYSDMVAKEFSEFTKSGHLLHYLDGFLYVTEDKEQAQEFLDKIKAGIQSYGCSFNPEKTKTNLPPYNNSEFYYLGYNLNVETLNIKPDYSNISLQYKILNSKPQTGAADDVFVTKIASSKWLKLSTMVLNPCINSKQVVVDSLKNAARLSAEKCYLLLLNTYDIENLNKVSAFKIFNDIKKNSLTPVLQKCRILLTKRRSKFTIRFGVLKFIFWSAYLKMFQKNELVYQKFSRLIKSQFHEKLSTLVYN